MAHIGFPQGHWRKRLTSPELQDQKDKEAEEDKTVTSRLLRHQLAEMDLEANENQVKVKEMVPKPIDIEAPSTAISDALG